MCVTVAKLQPLIKNHVAQNTLEITRTYFPSSGLDAVIITLDILLIINT